MSRMHGRFKTIKKLYTQLAQRATLTFHQCFRNKKILIISDKGISSLPVSARFQASIVVISMIGMLWVSYSTGKYFAYEDVISEKDLEIWNTSLDNESLQYQLSDLHSNLSDINGYLTHMQTFDQVKNNTSSGQEVAAGELGLENAPAIEAGADNHMESQDIATSSRKLLIEIRQKVQARIKSIESIIEMTGLDLQTLAARNDDIKDMLAELKPESGEELGQGGPYEPADLDDMPFERQLLQADVTYLLELERLLHSYPLAAPMARYYVSSNYGKRVDPVRRTKAMHSGIDLVGGHKANVIASAPGIVKHARRFGAYGNFIEIDHGNGITTRYGHLNRIFVRKDQEIARGDLIGLQGNTGRSTGSHLHYEVRFNNKALNPKYFLKAGTYVF